MNKDINNTLQALVPILQMNGEKVQRIEAVQDWYTIDGLEYMKEVAEITYTSGYRKYADIGCDANLTAVYDVMAVIQDIKPRSECIGRIVRGVYEMPSVEPGPAKEQARKNVIYEQTGEPAMLEQTAEECAELAQALLKLARAERGESPTPRSMEECQEKVLEEIADVETCLAQLTAAPWMNMEKIFEQIDVKTERWKRRIGMI